MGRKGRKRKSGQRYPSGDLQREGRQEGMTVALWQRLLQPELARARDPRLETHIGRLAVIGDLTPTQAAAGHKIAEIYGRFERSIGRRRSVVSPSYEAGRARGENLGGNDEAAIARDKAARRRFDELQDDIDEKCPNGVRWALEELCVDNRLCPPGWLDRVKVALDALAPGLGIMQRPGERTSPAKGEVAGGWRGRHRSLSTLPPEGRGNLARGLNNTKSARVPYQGDDFLGAVATLVPEMDADHQATIARAAAAAAEKAAVDTANALIERDKMRREKAAKAKAG